MEGWDIFTGGKVHKFKGQNASWRVPKESMAWFPGPKWNEFVLKCKLNVPNSKKRKVVGQAKSRQAYLAEGLSQLNAWTWLEQRENVCHFWSSFFGFSGRTVFIRALKISHKNLFQMIWKLVCASSTANYIPPLSFFLSNKRRFETFPFFETKVTFHVPSAHTIGCPCSLTNISISNNGGFMYGPTYHIFCYKTLPRKEHIFQIQVKHCQRQTDPDYWV